MTDVTLAEKVDADEMLDMFKEIQSGRFKSLPPAKVVGMVPDYAEYVGGELKVPDETRSGNGEAKQSLTKTGKEIIFAFNEGYSQREIDEEGIASESYAYRVKNNFDFLLEDDVLYSAFVLDGAFKLDSDFIYVLCDLDEEYGLAFSDPKIPDDVVADFQEVLDGQSKVVKLEGDDTETVKRNDPNPGKKERYTDLSEFVSDEVVGTSYDENPSTTDDTSSDGDSQDVSISRDEWKEVVKVLYRMSKDDLASKIIDGKL